MELPEDQAGLSAQCPRCGLLVDAPLLSDAGHLDTDGTYQLDKDTPRRLEDDFQHLARIYYPGRRLPDGSEIDLRGPVGPDVPLAGDEDQEQRERPRYDPVTGELIQPLSVEVPPEPRHDQIPEAQRIIDYNVTQNVLEGSPHGLSLLAALFQPVNLFVMLMIIGLHLFLMISGLIASVLILLIPIPLLLLATIAGHYAVIVQETGLWERDDLPRPLRNLSFSEDIIAPCLQTAGALLLCYWPAWLILMMNRNAAAGGAPLPFQNAGLWLIVCHIVASVFLPAVMLTMCTSGSIANLRPDRVLGVARVIGLRYFGLVLLWMIGGGVYVVGQTASLIGLIESFGFGTTPLIARVYIAFPLLFLGVYLAHAACWYLGLEYRRSHGRFPWIMQEHVRTVATIQRPKLHPKVARAQEESARRANRRREIR